MLRGRQTARLSVWCGLSNLAAAVGSRAKFSSPLSSVQSVEQFQHAVIARNSLDFDPDTDLGYTGCSSDAVRNL